MKAITNFSPLFLLLLMISNINCSDSDSDSDTEFSKKLEILNGKSCSKKTSEKKTKSKIEELQDKYSTNIFNEYLEPDARGIRGSENEFWIGVSIVSGIFWAGEEICKCGKSIYERLTEPDINKLNLSNIDKFSERLNEDDRIELSNKKNELLKIVSPELFDDLLDTKINVLERSSAQEHKLAWDILRMVNKKHNY